MSWNPASGDAQSSPDTQHSSQTSAPSGVSDVNPYGNGKCPECGVALDSVDPKKHVVTHWGADPIPVEPNTARQTLLARQRRAMLLGEQAPDR